MDEGWIKLHRKLVDWEWFDDANTLKVWLWLLCSANHVDGRWQGIEIPRGTLITSIGNMAAKLRLTPQKIRTSINRLKSTNEITTKATNKYTIITICKYDTYQFSESVSQQTRQQAVQQSANKQLTTNKNNKNEKNIIKEINKEKEIKKAQESFMISLSYYVDKMDRDIVAKFYNKYSAPEIDADGKPTGRLIWETIDGWDTYKMISQFWNEQKQQLHTN